MERAAGNNGDGENGERMRQGDAMSGLFKIT